VGGERYVRGRKERVPSERTPSHSSSFYVGKKKTNGRENVALLTIKGGGIFSGQSLIHGNRDMGEENSECRGMKISKQRKSVQFKSSNSGSDK